MDQPEQQLDFASTTAGIVSSYVANNSVHRGDLPNVIASVHAALQGLTALKQAEPEKPEPRVPIKKSVTPDFLISLEDGKKYKTLKRHLGKLGLTSIVQSEGSRPTTRWSHRAMLRGAPNSP